MDAIYKHAIERRQYKDHIIEHRGGSRQRSVEGKEPMDRPQVTLVQNIWLGSAWQISMDKYSWPKNYTLLQKSKLKYFSAQELETKGEEVNIRPKKAED